MLAAAYHDVIIVEVRSLGLFATPARPRTR